MDRFGVFCVDPGGVTGVARGVFDGEGCDGDFASVLLHGSDLESWECEGSWESQAWELAGEFLDWTVWLGLCGIGVADVHLVFESFRLRTAHADLSSVGVASGMRTLLVPRASAMGLEGMAGIGSGNGRRVASAAAGWVAGGVEYAGGVTVVEQEPADAKRFGTAERLKTWDLYLLGRGSEHKRDALRHLALRVARIIAGTSAAGRG